MDELAKNILIPSKEDPAILKATSSATISNIENGRNNPSAEITIALSDYFNVSTDWILKGENFQSSSSSNLPKISKLDFVKELQQIGKEAALEHEKHIYYSNKRSKTVKEMLFEQMMYEDVDVYGYFLEKVLNDITKVKEAYDSVHLKPSESDTQQETTEE